MNKINIPIRDVFGKTLVKFARKNKKIYSISPDLKSATKLDYFHKSIPERFIETGIAEANSIGIAAGMALSGLKPVIACFASFITGKNLEIRISIAFNNAPVIIVGTHGGLIGPDGPTQSGLQDISVMRSMPNMKVLQPASAKETVEIIKYALKCKSPVYIRISRQANKEIYLSKYSFKIGEQVVIRKNMSKAVIFTSGNLVDRCLHAIEILKDKNIGLVNFPSIEPLNKKSLIAIINKTQQIYCFEDHSTKGGLGSKILETISDTKIQKKIKIFGIDEFTRSGEVEELYKYYKLDGLSIAKRILNS